VESYLVEKGIRVLSVERLSEARHIFTHVVWEMHGFLALCEGENDAFLFLTKDEILSSYAIPTAYRTYVKLMKE
jgi:A/G-specific adenine glycosylase